MEAALMAVQMGEMSFATFTRETWSDWTAIATSLMRRWRAPTSVDTADLIQELLLGAWQSLPKWNPSKAGLKRYVVFQAISAAKTWLHAQRGASKHGNRDRNPGRMPVPSGDLMASELGRTASKVTKAVQNAMPTVEATQERLVLHLQHLQLASRLLRTARERVVFQAVIDAGSIEGALVALGKNYGRADVLKTVQLVALHLEQE